jgi:hypothetical protein
MLSTPQLRAKHGAFAFFADAETEKEGSRKFASTPPFMKHAQSSLLF